jgi:hypothetical protein
MILNLSGFGRRPVAFAFLSLAEQMQARLPSFKRSATRQNAQRYSIKKEKRYAIVVKKSMMLRKYGASDQKINTQAFCGGIFDFVFCTEVELIFSQRGMHNVNNELVFKSNLGFVFHDSRGFEAGAVEEFDRVKEFIMERSKELYLRDQLHVIWWVIVDLEFVRSISCPYRYCIPMDDERPFTAAERSFFAECGTGSGEQ